MILETIAATTLWIPMVVTKDKTKHFLIREIWKLKASDKKNIY